MIRGKYISRRFRQAAGPRQPICVSTRRHPCAAPSGNAVRNNHDERIPGILRGSKKMNLRSLSVLAAAVLMLAACKQSPDTSANTAGGSGAATTATSAPSGPAGLARGLRSECRRPRLLRLRPVGHQGRGPDDAAAPGDVAEEISERHRHGRRTLRRARHARIQPRARQPPRQRREERARGARHPREPHPDHQLRQGPADRGRLQRGGLGAEPHRHHRHQLTGWPETEKGACPPSATGSWSGRGRRPFLPKTPVSVGGEGQG